MSSFIKSLRAFAIVLVLSMLLTVMASVNSTAQHQNKTGLEGVWKVAEVTVPPSSPTDKSTTITAPQPSIIIFTKRYYSTTRVPGAQPRATLDAPKDPQNLTDAEKIARFDQWSQFIANAGTYEVQGTTLIMHPIVAKNVSVMSNPTPITWEMKMDGANSLWLTPPAGRATTDGQLKLARLE